MINCSEGKDDFFKDYLKNNSVRNIIPPNMTCLFIFESPHTYELDFDYPVAGRTGKKLSEVIFMNREDKKNKSFGSYVKENEDSIKIGITNVCTAPLQRTNSALQTDLDDECFRLMNVVRKRAFKKHSKKNEYASRIENIIFENFKCRMNKVDASVQIVTFGNFSKTFLERYNNSVSPEYIKKDVVFFPHPASVMWTNMLPEEKSKLMKIAESHGLEI